MILSYILSFLPLNDKKKEYHTEYCFTVRTVVQFWDGVEGKCYNSFLIRCYHVLNKTDSVLTVIFTAHVKTCPYRSRVDFFREGKLVSKVEQFSKEQECMSIHILMNRQVCILKYITIT